MAAQVSAGRGSARSKARKRALDILFEADLRGISANDVLAVHTAEADPPVRPFTADLVGGVLTSQGTLDRIITESLPAGWTLSRMPRVDRNLARIATYEITHTDLAPQIAIAEAVSLSEALSTDESPAFLNGLLGAIARRHAAGTA